MTDSKTAAGTKWTEGPWVASLDSEAIRVRSPDGSSICTLNWLTTTGRRDSKEGAANARLIATAPDLYSAAEPIADIVANFTGDDDTPFTVLACELRALLKACRAARGETEG